MYDLTFGTLSPPTMNSLYTLGAAASIDAVESELSCYSHSSFFLLTDDYEVPTFLLSYADLEVTEEMILRDNRDSLLELCLRSGFT